MSTRAIITVEGLKGVGLYKHFDGYPENTLPWLEEFNKDFTENRGSDPEYKFAQLVRSSARDAEKYHLDASLYTGWGILVLKDTQWDCAYHYILKKDGTVSYK